MLHTDTEPASAAMPPAPLTAIVSISWLAERVDIDVAARRDQRVVADPRGGVVAQNADVDAAADAGDADPDAHLRRQTPRRR